MTPGPTQLCDSCKAVPWGAKGWRDFFLNESWRTRLHYMDFGIPYKSIAYDAPSSQFFEQARKCEWCQFLKNGLKKGHSDGDDTLWLRDVEPAQDRYKTLSFTIRFFETPNVRPEKLAMIRIICLAQSDSGFTDFHLRLGIAARQGGPASKVFASPDAGLDFAASGFKAGLAQKWITDCTQQHSLCGSTAPVDLPTRLLHISDEGGSTRVKLQESGPGEQGLYVCLSYSWGAREGLQEEFAQLGRRLTADSLPLDSLPRTFQDAARVCQGVGLRYLWVDALCIRQGDETDKSRELRAMHHYYGNARLVIQPSGTNSVDEGFLGSSRLPKLSQWLYSLQDATSLDSPAIQNAVTDFAFLKVPFVPLQASQDHVQDDIFLHEVPDPTWYYNYGAENAASRGWILQEELLCKRILTFPSTGGMTFRCSGSDNMLTDENVFCHPDRHQPLTFPKKKLWGNEGLESLGIHLVSDKLKGMLQQARKLAAAGENHPLVTVSATSGALHLNHDFSEPLHISENDFAIAPVYSEAKINLEREGGANFRSPARSVSSYAALLILPGHTDNPALRTLPIYTDPPPHAISAVGANQAWLRTVDDYCRRKLTNPGDKLPAIAALGREYSARYGGVLGSYVVGVWEAFLAEGLCWKVPPNRIEPRPAREPAPSWSWAAVEGAMFDDAQGRDDYEHDLNSSSIEVKIKGVKLVVAGEGLEYESVKQGTLQLEGKLLDCSWAKLPVNEGGYRFFLVEQSTKELLGKRCYVLPDCREYAKEEIASLSFLLIRRSNRGIGEHDDCFEGLILRHTDADHGYNRVGYAVWHCKKADYEEGVALRFRHEAIEIT